MNCTALYLAVGSEGGNGRCGQSTKLQAVPYPEKQSFVFYRLGADYGRLCRNLLLSSMK